MKQSFRSFFTDKKGHIAVWQSPNVPLVTWFVATILAKILTHGRSNSFVSLIAFGALFTWAWLEISSGISLFRRALGMAVLVIIIKSRI